MISKVLIIRSGGILCYSKTLYGHELIDDDFVSGFLTTILEIAQKIGGGEIRSLNFRNFNIIYSYDKEKLCIFVLIADINDLEHELMENLELLKSEFIKRYRRDLIHWDSDISKFDEFDNFVEKKIFISPKILLVGEDGVGKTTIMDLFPGDTILELDNDMNERIQKTIFIHNKERIIPCVLKEINFQDILDNPTIYKQTLDSATVICIVTNSGASNLTRTKRLLSLLKPNVTNSIFYVIANFQDLQDASFNPEQIEKFFELKTYSISATSKNAKEKAASLFKEMLDDSRVRI
ncbi:MAG: hypothetical protein ACFE9R_16745 [Candidatus Hermodarchaeota archaeon]